MEHDFLYHCQHIFTMVFHVWLLEFISHSVNTVCLFIDPLLPIKAPYLYFYKYLIYQISSLYACE